MAPGLLTAGSSTIETEHLQMKLLMIVIEGREVVDFRFEVPRLRSGQSHDRRARLQEPRRPAINDIPSWKRNASKAPTTP